MKLTSEFKHVGEIIQYKQYFQTDQVNDNLDMKNFSHFLLHLSELLVKKDSLKINILGSSSDISSAKFKDNKVLANYRAFSFKDEFINYVFQSGFDVSKIEIVSMESIVQPYKIENKKKLTELQYVLITCY